MTDHAFHLTVLFLSLAGLAAWVAWMIVPPLLDLVWATVLFWLHTRKNR